MLFVPSFIAVCHLFCPHSCFTHHVTSFFFIYKTLLTMHNGETTTMKLTDAIFFWFYKPCQGAYSSRHIPVYSHVPYTQTLSFGEEWREIKEWGNAEKESVQSSRFGCLCREPQRGLCQHGLAGQDEQGDGLRSWNLSGSGPQCYLLVFLCMFE